MSQKIYFDESGFTGNNLLHPRQNYFAYASVATNDDEARTVVERIIKKNNIQGGELKGKNLVKFAKGRKIITEILDLFDGRIKISVSDKKFALAAKLHEYIFEPCYSEVNSLFYGIGFHRYIANVLYMEFVSRGAGADELFTEFEKLMREGEGHNLEAIFSSSAIAEHSEIIKMIREFAQKRNQDIRSELKLLADGETGKWVLDLTNSALFTLLASWGLEHEVLTAVCDHSKPLQHNQEMFTTMIGNTSKTYSEIEGNQYPLTFNLSGPIEFSTSHESHGIQIADVVAAAAVYVFSGNTDDSADRWRHAIARQAHYGSVVPDIDELKLDVQRGQTNALVLQHLHQRAMEDQNLTEGMAGIIEHLKRALASPRFQMGA
ncbi:DUF3800 domain-containing protein [Pseudomonas kilonensis]